MPITVLGAPSLAASPEPQAGPPGLSAEQRALFLAARPAPLSAAAASPALAQFLLEGDEAAYEAATGPKRSVSEQVEAHLKAIASLSAAQRQALFR